jgi:O-methyltransferase
VGMATRRRLRANPAGLLVPKQELARIYTSLLDEVVDPRTGPGVYLEFGVFAGDSMAVMARVSAEHGWPDLPLVGFDSFEGLPATVGDSPHDEAWYAHQFSCPESLALENLRDQGVDLDRVELVKGWFDETLTDELAARLVARHGHASVVMVDCDAYVSAVPALAFLDRFIVDRTAVVMDDWYAFNADEGGRGVQRAFEEWLERSPQLTAEAIDDYRHTGFSGKVFVVSRGG